MTSHDIHDDCRDCQHDVMLSGDYFMVYDEVWEAATRPGEYSRDPNFLLCVRCLENRLGRALRPWDFTEVPLNYAGVDQKSQLLRERLGLWFSHFQYEGKMAEMSEPRLLGDVVEELQRRQEMTGRQRQEEIQTFV